MKEDVQAKLKDFELIGRFLDFDLSEEELKQFEVRMEKDVVLQNRFSLYQEMAGDVDELFVVDAADAKNTFQTKSQSEKKIKEVKIKSFPIKRILSIAASVVVLFGAGFWWMNSSSGIDSNLDLANHYWNITDSAHLYESIKRSDETTIDPNETARVFFREIRNLQKNKQFAGMVSKLEEYKKSTISPLPFADDADWLLAIAYLYNNDLTEAYSQLQYIVNNYPSRAKKAQRLLDDIKTLEEKGSVSVEDF